MTGFLPVTFAINEDHEPKITDVQRCDRQGDQTRHPGQLASTRRRSARMSGGHINPSNLASPCVRDSSQEVGAKLDANLFPCVQGAWQRSASPPAAPAPLNSRRRG